ncbi:MAG: hypothetical protein HY906_23835 [Deltaproteobacteria bacterium]|nr:hypothetical protein [Deltaproteobacteria bacterium]
MFSLHCTARLLEALRVEPRPPPAATTRLGSWYANLLPGRRPAVVCVSERTFLPVVLPQEGARLPLLLPEALAALLQALDVPRHLIEQERLAMAQVTWARTESRSVLGVLNEQAYLASELLEDDRASFAAITRRLADNIVKLQFPVDLTLEAFGLAPPSRAGHRAPHPAPPAPRPPSTGDVLADLARELAAVAKRPVDGFVVGEPVQVSGVLWDGNQRRGLVAVCQRGDDQHQVSLADVVFPEGSPAAQISATYRAWLGLSPTAPGPPPRRRHKATDLDLSRPIELVVLAVKSNALRCRLAGTQRELTFRTPVRDEVPGELVTVRAAKQWTHAGHPYLSGAVQSSRLDVAALALAPLEVRPMGDWDPAEEYWGEEGEALTAWATAIIARGPRPAFELEQVIPGADPDDWDSDPILEANDLKAAGHHREANELLNGLLAQDLRCLDAHAHLGNAEYAHSPDQALRHYRAGAAIGDQALGAGFTGVLPWGLTDNRPYLRCLHGVGLCLWRLGQKQEASAVFTRILWLNPTDNQGARFNLEAVERGHSWDEAEGGEPQENP